MPSNQKKTNDLQAANSLGSINQSGVDESDIDEIPRNIFRYKFTFQHVQGAFSTALKQFGSTEKFFGSIELITIATCTFLLLVNLSAEKSEKCAYEVAAARNLGLNGTQAGYDDSSEECIFPSGNNSTMTALIQRAGIKAWDEGRNNFNQSIIYSGVLATSAFFLLYLVMKFKQRNSPVNEETTPLFSSQAQKQHETPDAGHSPV